MVVAFISYERQTHGDPVVDGIRLVDIWGLQTSTGLTGYPTTITVSTLANLASLLPGFNLSFVSGDPNSIVYVSQTAAMLSPSEFECPEPTALALLGTSLLGLGLIRRRRT
jgi:PEP-CTERM motif